MFAQTRPGMQEGPEGPQTPAPVGVPASASPTAPNPSMGGWDVRRSVPSAASPSASKHSRGPAQPPAKTAADKDVRRPARPPTNTAPY